jgi:hypothetical protein
VGCCIRSGLDPGENLPSFEGVEELVVVVGSIAKHPVYRVLLAAVVLGSGRGTW